MDARYLIEFRSMDGGVLLGYRRQLLHSVEVNCELSVTQLTWLWGWAPITETMLLSQRGSEKFRITKQQSDLSFAAFWDTYGYKVGKKDRAEKLWSNLRDDERVAALNGIQRYKSFIAARQIAQAYPETWLAQRRWENEFKLF